jgi:hypothetical protein
MTRRSFIAAALGLSTPVALAGCRTEDDNRPLELKQGTYLGRKDEALTKDQLKELRERAEQMR